MVNSNISKKLTKLIKQHELVKKSLKKKNGEIYLSKFKEKLSIGFYNPRKTVKDDEIIVID